MRHQEIDPDSELVRIARGVLLGIVGALVLFGAGLGWLARRWWS